MVLRHPSHISAASRRRRTPSGFTLVELMIAVLVVGILTAIALPNFQDSIRKSRRAEAMTALTQLQQAQERRRSSVPAYEQTLSALNLPDTTPSGRYTISVAQAMAETSATLQPWNIGYIAMAYGKDGTSQAADSDCRRMAMRMVNGNLTYAGCGSCASFAFGDFAVSHKCWTQ